MWCASLGPGASHTEHGSSLTRPMCSRAALVMLRECISEWLAVAYHGVDGFTQARPFPRFDADLPHAGKVMLRHFDKLAAALVNDLHGSRLFAEQRIRFGQHDHLSNPRFVFGHDQNGGVSSSRSERLDGGRALSAACSTASPNASASQT